MGASTLSAKRGVKILKASFGLTSNNAALINDPQYFEAYEIQSQWANFPVDDIPFRDGLDAYVEVYDLPGVSTHISFDESKIVAIGDFSDLERQSLDRRYSLFGNQGLFFRHALTVLERRHHIFNFHACSFYDEKEHHLILVCGGMGGGKSAVMLAVTETGLFKILSSEMVHASVSDDGIVFYRGSPRNNVRLGHLVEDFPKLVNKLGITLPEAKDVWGTKYQVSLEKFLATQTEILNPAITVVLPRIEENVERPRVDIISNRGKIVRTLHENITDKIRSLSTIYETIPVGSLDDVALTTSRLEFVKRFLEKGNIVKIASIFASPHNCLEGWL